MPGSGNAAGRIAWDRTSLFLDGRRLILWSGEFHYWRLPSPQRWRDILEKIRAGGCNAVSIYFPWHFHSPAPGVYDFTGVRDIDLLLRRCAEAGLFVLARPGPYINAETDAGGLPAWLLTRHDVALRERRGMQASDSPAYREACREWWEQVIPRIAPHQITRGGPVIALQVENEYVGPEPPLPAGWPVLTGSRAHMDALYRWSRELGIDVPIFHNDAWLVGSWKDEMDLYGFDLYPAGFSVEGWDEETFARITDRIEEKWEALGLTGPVFIPELQGGYFQPWGGQGYDTVYERLGPAFTTLLQGSVLGQGATAVNTYMLYGGTTWGYLPFPGVYSSYDYGAAIRESGLLGPRFDAHKRLAMFATAAASELGSARRVPVTDPGIAETEGLRVACSDPAMLYAVRHSRETRAAFIFLRNARHGEFREVRLDIDVDGRHVGLPGEEWLDLPGPCLRILPVNVALGPVRLLASTGQILTRFDHADTTVAALFCPSADLMEAVLEVPDEAEVATPVGLEARRTDGWLTLRCKQTDAAKAAAISVDDRRLILILTDEAYASRIWRVEGPDRPRLIMGPYLARAGVHDGGHAVEVDRDTDVRVLDPEARSIDVGEPLLGLATERRLAGPKRVELPTLEEWRFAPEGPEAGPGYDDADWIPATRPLPSRPYAPPGPPVLACDEYGFHYGFVWYRGRFLASGREVALRVRARHSWAVYLDGKLIGSGDEAPLAIGVEPEDAQEVALPAGALKPGEEHVIAVLVEHLGHAAAFMDADLPFQPRGLLEAQLLTADGAKAGPITWRVMGAGERPADAVRGHFNASGLHGERHGWHLPEFNDAGWERVTLPHRWADPGLSDLSLAWYRCRFTLALPEDHDVPLGLRLEGLDGKALIFCNGWLVGRYWSGVGPQDTFYLPPGVLQERGENVIAIAVWHREAPDEGLADVRLVPYGALRRHTLEPEA